jgi:hypothetical protein
VKVYVVIETASHDYDPNEYTNIYGVYASETAAEQAKKKCESQKHGRYYADIEEHEVSE